MKSTEQITRFGLSANKPLAWNILHLKYNLFTGLWGYGNIDDGMLPALQLTHNSSHQA